MGKDQTAGGAWGNTCIDWWGVSVPRGSAKCLRRLWLPLQRRGDCADLSVRIVRRLSTVPGRQGLVDFEQSMIIWKVREVERSERSAAWF